LISEATARPRSMMWLFVAFAGPTLLLAAIGIYGTVSHSVAQRRYEIGIRLALGARSANVLALALRQVAVFVMIGIVCGIAASMALTRMLAVFLYGVAATDPLTFLSVGVLVAAIALIAAYLPARRAATANPMTALRVA
jgi:putative ABC transport system permease protein